MLGEPRRLLKAALLYADTVQDSGLTLQAYMPMGSRSNSRAVAYLAIRRLAGLLAEREDLADVKLPRVAEDAVQVAYGDIHRAVQAGAFRLTDRGFPSSVTWQTRNAALDRDLFDRSKIQVSTRIFSNLRGDAPTAAAWEGAVAATLIGQLEAFPDAEMDAILDVRRRLDGPRTHFRAAVAEVARELADAGRSSHEQNEIMRDLRVRVVEPALQHIREALDALGARRTLMRVASDRAVLTAAGAQIAVIPAALGTGLGGLVSGAFVGAVGAAAAKEREYRASVIQELRGRPYWILHDADRRLRRDQ
jgi:F0F1-type ATP synthase membrane subunit c/vacuolar-type H+-ATPase subunit K